MIGGTRVKYGKEGRYIPHALFTGAVWNDTARVESAALGSAIV